MKNVVLHDAGANNGELEIHDVVHEDQLDDSDLDEEDDLFDLF